jgi:hypothetical protein
MVRSWERRIAALDAVLDPPRPRVLALARSLPSPGCYAVALECDDGQKALIVASASSRPEAERALDVNKGCHLIQGSIDMPTGSWVRLDTAHLLPPPKWPPRA